MKSIILYVIVLLALLALFASEVLSKPVKKGGEVLSKPEKKGGKVLSDPEKKGGKVLSEPKKKEGKVLSDPEKKEGKVLSDPKKKGGEVLSEPETTGKEGFCKNKTLSDGTQIKGGSCSTTIQGDIPNINAMTSSFITFPDNEAVLEPNKAFNVEVAINNLQTGFFSDPETEYNASPQTLDDKGIIKGHSHVTIQKLNGLSPPDAVNFEFFKGLNDKAKNGILVAEVVRGDGTPGLPAGKYRICSMSGSFSHQPLIMPVAKRGAQDDCIRVTVGAPIQPNKPNKPNKPNDDEDDDKDDDKDDE